MSSLNPTPALAWLLLAIAGAVGVAWAAGMKFTAGFSRPLASGVVTAAALASLALLGLAMKALPVDTAHAAWVGIGAAGAMLAGSALFDEPATALRLGCVLLIIAGVAGLKLADG